MCFLFCFISLLTPDEFSNTNHFIVNAKRKCGKHDVKVSWLRGTCGCVSTLLAWVKKLYGSSRSCGFT